MAFQFQCPQCANVLQAEDFQAGQQSYCPMCGAMFLIPSPYVAPAPGPSPGMPHPGSQFPAVEYPAGPATPPTFQPFPGVGPGHAPGAGPGAVSHPSVLPPQPPAPAFELREPELLHIPCPQCKEMLETPVEMLDQEVLCPHCQAQFQLRRRDSVEFKRKKQQEAQIKEIKAGNTWLNLAIVAVVLVVLFLGSLIVWQIYGKPG
ncbi:MAG TPA: hypothetical protein PK640_19955 [Verrucomicrobiota bacterium]|nr:hypothetical protein [Verrucomicrobiota bacterium]HPM79210.1 hypothetical protein [Candidatus Anammoximicrobium sp.]